MTCVDKKIEKTIYPFIHLLSKPTVHQPVRQATYEKTTITTQVTLECVKPDLKCPIKLNLHVLYCGRNKRT